MTTGRKILSVALALTLWGQAVAVDYLHHHLVTGIPGRTVPLVGIDTASCRPSYLASATTDSGHSEANCPFCLFLQNFHGRTINTVFHGAGLVYRSTVPATLSDSAPLSGHLNHAGPRAPPADHAV